MKLILELFREFPGWLDRGVSRWTGRELTHKYLFRDVRKIRNVEVSGDYIAWIERGAK